MKRVVFVCLGNICRSPIAEFVLKSLAEQASIPLEIASRATSREEEGNPIYPPAKDILYRHGVPFDKGKRATLLSRADVEYYDLIVVMEDWNMRSVLRMYPHAQPKLHKLLDYCGGGDVADPWYTGDFEQAYQDILRGCTALLERL